MQFRRSIVDLSTITDISPRVLSDAVFSHGTGLALLLAPSEGESAEEVSDRSARQIVSALRSRYEVVVIDCGSQLQGASAAAIEMADTALLVTTPDVIAVRGAKRVVRMWERLQIRKAEDTVTLVNRFIRNTEIQPQLIEKITGTTTANTAVPANFKELQSVVDAGRLHELDSKSTVKQALWALAGELGIVKVPEKAEKNGAKSGAKFKNDRGSIGRRRDRDGDSRNR